MVITAEHLALAKSLGACGERLRRYKVGQPITSVEAYDLAWIECRAPRAAAEMTRVLCAKFGIVMRAAMPLTLFGSGDGYGYGYGYGSGDGSGDGYGSGYGYGYGSGSGSGSGDGYGYGSGSGSGDGYGSGYGYGDGDGSGSGST